METGFETTYRPKDFRTFLQEELILRCKRNPKYSLRAFAKALEMDISSLSKILSGQRPLGRKLISKLGRRLGLDPETTEAYVRGRGTYVAAEEQGNAGDSGPQGASAAQVLQYQQLTLDHFRIISDWYHYAILELMRVEGFKSDARAVARSLGISVNEVNAAVSRLERTGMIEIEANGKWKDITSGTSTTVGNPFTDTAFRNLQRQLLEKALVALEEVPISRRDHTSMTMAIDSRKLPEAKERIKKFRRELDQFLGQGSPNDSVYNISIALFPLSVDAARKKEEKKERKS